MILQESFVNKKVDDKTWSVFSGKKIVFRLDGSLTNAQVANTMELAKEFELKAHQEGVELLVKLREEKAQEILNYQEQIKELAKRNNILAIKLQKYL